MWTFGDVGCSFRLVNICVRYFFFFKKNQCAKGDFIQSSIDPWEKFGFGFWDGFLARVFLFLAWDGVFHYLFFHSKVFWGGSSYLYLLLAVGFLSLLKPMRSRVSFESEFSFCR